MAGRTRGQRRVDALRRLESEANAWVATGSADGIPHLVPLSLAWDGSTFVLATEARSVTAANIAQSHRARLALENTEDVVTFETAPIMPPNLLVCAEMIGLLAWG